MIRVFGYREATTDLENLNGDVILNPLKAVVHKYENGDYYLELEVGSEYSNCFEEDRIIVADIPNASRDYFRIGNVIKGNGRCKSKCYHIFYDLKKIVGNFNAGSSVRFYSTTFYNALYTANNLNTWMISSNERFTITDYTISGETDFASELEVYRAITMYDFIQNLLKNHGGYLVRSKRSFGISRIRPTRDNGVTIQYGKNLKSMTKEEDWSEVINNLQAYTTSKDMQEEYNIVAPLTYRTLSGVQRFDNTLNPADYSSSQAYEQARRQKLADLANAYLEEHKAPKIKYTLDAYLGEMPNGAMEIQDLGDQVKVIDEQLGIDVIAYVLGYDLDLLTNKFTKIEFGNYVTSMKGYNDKVNDKITFLQDNVTNISYPIGCMLQTDGSNPSLLGVQGYWTLVSSSGGIYTYKRTA